VLDPTVDDVHLLGQLLVSAVGPQFETAVLQLVHIGVLQLCLEHHFHVADVLARLLEVTLLEFGQVALGRQRQRLQAPDLLPYA